MLGYIMMKRNIANATGMCGIAMQASYPIKAKAPVSNIKQNGNLPAP